MADHPDIERTIATGHPKPEPKPLTGELTMTLHVSVYIDADDEVYTPKDIHNKAIELSGSAGWVVCGESQLINHEFEADN